MPLKFNEAISEDLKYEEIEKSERPGVLKTIKGVITNYLPNRNGRVYPKSLWEKAINSDLVQEQIACNCFFGESPHPTDDRMDIDISKISHAVRDIKIGADSVTAVIDVLDTPYGNIINKLIEYGSKIGISSRGCGSLDDTTNVVQDDYQLFAFDIVARPSVAAARLTEAEELMRQGKALISESEIKNIINNYRNNILNESSTINKETSTKDITKKLILESERLNRITRIN